MVCVKFLRIHVPASRKCNKIHTVNFSFYSFQFYILQQTKLLSHNKYNVFTNLWMIEQTKLVLKIFIYGKKTRFITTIYVLQRPLLRKDTKNWIWNVNFLWELLFYIRIQYSVKHLGTLHKNLLMILKIFCVLPVISHTFLIKCTSLLLRHSVTWQQCQWNFQYAFITLNIQDNKNIKNYVMIHNTH